MTRIFLTLGSATALITSSTAIAAQGDIQSPNGAAGDTAFVAATGDGAASIRGNEVAPLAKQSGAATKDKRISEAELNKMAERLSDPAMQDGIAAMAEEMAAMLMQMPVGKFAKSIEKARPGSIKKPVPEDATIADLAGGKAAEIPADMGDKMKDAMGMMSGFVKVFAGILPEFEAMAREMGKKIEKAKLPN